MLNAAGPERAFDFQFLPNDGVGLARLEFIINRNIGVHSRALLGYQRQPPEIQKQIDEHNRSYPDPVSFYIEKLVEGIAFLFDERNEAIKSLMSMAISSCRRLNKYIGIYGQSPSDYPELAFWLIEQGISSISLNPDSVIETWLYLAENRPEQNTNQNIC